MKAKLLKKVRKRFEIIHMPNGYVSNDGVHFQYNLFKLIDKDREWTGSLLFVQSGLSPKKTQYCNSELIFTTDEGCIDYLKRVIIIRLREDGYRGRKDHKIVCNSNKVWWGK